MTIALIVLTFWKMSALKEKTYADNSVSSNRSNTLVDNYLVQQTPINGGKMFSDTHKKEQLKRKNDRLTKQNFFGVYVGIKNNHVIFTGQNGRANVTLGSAYKLHSVLMAGKYQEFLNNAMIVRLASNHEVDLNRRLSSYLPGIDTGKLTVKGFLLHGSSLFISQKNASDVSLIPHRNYDGLELSKTRLRSSISADNLIKCLLLSKVKDEAYYKAFRQIAGDKMNLNNVDFKMSYSNEANLIISYYKRNKDTAKMKAVKIDDSVLGLNTMRMSIADVLASFNAIYSNDFFGESYNSIFMKSIMNSNLVTKSGNTITLSAGSYGQEFTIKYSDKKSKYLFSFVNVKDEKQIMLDLQGLYNLL